MEPTAGRRHYEDPAFWSPARWGESRPAVERARLAREWLPLEGGTVLDVGCGNGVFLHRLPESFRAVGLDRSWAALKEVRRPCCLGDAGALPFADRSCDAVVTMEMLEHLPYATYPSALAELVRVARHYILVTVPYGERRAHSQVTCPICGCQFHVYDHVRSFERADMEALFRGRPGVRLVRLEGIFPEPVPVLPGLWNLVRRYHHRGGRNFPWYTTCPQCGYRRPQASAAPAGPEPARSKARSLSALWPRRRRYAWWMALYRIEP